jgi:hypothetical protein
VSAKKASKTLKPEVVAAATGMPGLITFRRVPCSMAKQLKGGVEAQLGQTWF